MAEETKTKICCYITIGRKSIVTSLSPSIVDNSYCTSDAIFDCIADKESARWPSHRFILNFMKLKFSYVVNKWQSHTTHYSEIFEKTVLIFGMICSFSYSLFCAVFYKVRCGQAVICVVFLVVTSVVRISLLDFFFFFFCKFRPSYFRYHFCSPLLVSVFLTLLIFTVYVFHK